MKGKLGNSLIIIENGQLNTYVLDDKLEWEVGRPAKDNQPDIKLYPATISRRHGKFQNIDGVWFYFDYNGKNGTIYNDKHVNAGMKGRIKPIMLSDGDIFVYGGGEKTVINSQTVWAMYSNKLIEEKWRVVNTKNCKTIAIKDGDKLARFEEPAQGSVYDGETGMAIYMGDITYLVGDVCLLGH